MCSLAIRIAIFPLASCFAWTQQQHSSAIVANRLNALRFKICRLAFRTAKLCFLALFKNHFVATFALLRPPDLLRPARRFFDASKANTKTGP